MGTATNVFSMEDIDNWWSRSKQEGCISQNFISAQKQQHGSSAKDSVSLGLVSFKWCKLESKTRGKALGKVDTMETYQLPQA